MSVKMPHKGTIQLIARDLGKEIVEVQCKKECVLVKKLTLLLAVVAAWGAVLAAELAAAEEVSLDGWKAVRGDCRIEDGAVELDAAQGLAYAIAGDAGWQNYEISATVAFLALGEKGEKGARLGVAFRAADDDGLARGQCTLRLAAKEAEGVAFAEYVQGKDDAKTSEAKVRKRAMLAENRQLGKPQNIRIRLEGTQVSMFIDDKPVLSSAFCLQREQGYVGLVASGCTARFENVKVRTLPPSPQLGELPLQPCEIVAHRGFSHIAPENTLSSIRAAVAAGADGCEFDVYRTKDGAVVLMHDETVERTTDGKGNVTEMTLAELKKLDVGKWKHEKYAGERIATLDEALAELQGTDCIPVIEIKMDGMGREVVEAVAKAGMIERAVVISFRKAAVKEVRELEPRLACAWLYGDDIAGSPPEQAEWIAAEAASCKAEMVDLDAAILSPELIGELQQRGLKVWCWTVDDAAEMDALMRWGIGSITTNRPDVLRPLVEKAK